MGNSKCESMYTYTSSGVEGTSIEGTHDSVDHLVQITMGHFSEANRMKILVYLPPGGIWFTLT